MVRIMTMTCKAKVISGVLFALIAIIGAQGQVAKSKAAARVTDTAVYSAYQRASRLREDMVHPEKFSLEHVQTIDGGTCIVYQTGDTRAAVLYSSDSKYDVVSQEDCLKAGRDVTDDVKRLLSKQRLPTVYSVSELTGRLAYHWADQIRRYEAMDYGDDSDTAAAEVVLDELKREMDEHEAFLKSKGDKQIMFMLSTAMTFASIHRSEIGVAFVTPNGQIPEHSTTSIPCTYRIQDAAKAFEVPASLSSDCELRDDPSGKPATVDGGKVP